MDFIQTYFPFLARFLPKPSVDGAVKGIQKAVDALGRAIDHHDQAAKDAEAAIAAMNAQRLAHCDEFARAFNIRAKLADLIGA